MWEEKLDNVAFFIPEVFSPYESLINTGEDAAQVLGSLQNIAHEEFSVLITTFKGLLQVLPPKDFLRSTGIELKVEQIISQDELRALLVKLGYLLNPQAGHPGTFSIRGEIVDIYPMAGAPVRIQYFDDLIEKIYEIDTTTYKSIKENELEKVEVGFSIYQLFEDQFLNNLRKNIPIPSPKFKNKFEKKEKNYFKN